MSSVDSNLVIIFAKAPVAGFTKTRLIPALGEQGAADFQAALVMYTINAVLPDDIRSSFQWEVELWLGSNDMPEFFEKIKQQHELALCLQQGCDLGERMLHAITASLNKYERVVLIGTDCPVINQETILTALSLLENNDMVFNPAEDGGYVLIAAKRIAPIVFSQVAWGTPEVMQQTLRNLKRSNLSWALADQLWDIDTPQDLNRLQREGHALARELPPE